MHLEKFVKSNTGKFLMSILLGFGLATFFREVCKGKRCKIISSPPVKEIDDQVYKFNNKCYKFNMNPINCSKNKTTIEMVTIA